MGSGSGGVVKGGVASESPSIFGNIKVGVGSGGGSGIAALDSAFGITKVGVGKGGADGFLVLLTLVESGRGGGVGASSCASSASFS